MTELTIDYVARLVNPDAFNTALWWNVSEDRMHHAQSNARVRAEAILSEIPVTGAEDWGIVMDALIREREHALDRKRGNRASNSDDRAETCTRLIEAIGAAFNPQPTARQSQGSSAVEPKA